MDRSDHIQNYLTGQLQMRALLEIQKKAIQQLTSNPETFMALVNSNPEDVICAIHMLLENLDYAHKAHDEVFEMYLTLRDEIDTITQALRD